MPGEDETGQLLRPLRQRRKVLLSVRRLALRSGDGSTTAIRGFAHGLVAAESLFPRPEGNDAESMESRNMSDDGKTRVSVGYAAGFVIVGLVILNVVADETALADQERWIRLPAKLIMAVVLAVVFVVILGRLKRS